MTRDTNWRSYVAAMGLGASAYLPHPINPARLVGALAEALKPPRRLNRNGKQIRRRTR